MKHQFRAAVTREGRWYVARCLEVDVAASQGKTEKQALANLREAPELHFERPSASIAPQIRTVAVAFASQG